MKATGNTLFDITNALFADIEVESDNGTVIISGKDYINSLTRENAKQNIFKINRRVAKMYPLQAQAMNNTKSNPLDVLKFWSQFLYTGGKYVPNWIFGDGSASSDNSKKKEPKKYTKKDLRAYADAHNISTRDVESALKLIPEAFEKDVVEYTKLMNEVNKNL